MAFTLLLYIFETDVFSDAKEQRKKKRNKEFVAVSFTPATTVQE
jgi:hypothetical protein